MSIQEIKAIMAAKLREFRLKSGYTSREVGDMVGRDKNAVTAWERGQSQPDADMLIKLCHIYGIKNVSEFYGQVPNDGITLTESEIEIISVYRDLNKEGQKAILNSVRGFSMLPDFQKEEHGSSAI